MRTHGGDRQSYPDCRLDFSVNLNPMGMPNSVREALHRAVDACESYPDPQCRRLRSALSKRYGLPAEWFFCGNGAAEVLFRCIRTLRPKRAILPIPTFSEYATALEAVCCPIQTVSLLPETHFALQDSFLDQLTQDIDLCILCNPNNPTGRLLPQSLLERIVARCREKQIMLLVDECFLELTEGISLTGMLAENPHVILLQAFTKSFALAGVRIGYAITAQEALLRKMERQGQPWNVSVLAQEAGIAAAREPGIYLDQTKQELKTEREKMTSFFREHGVTVIPSDANFLLFFSRVPLFSRLLERGILIREGRTFAGLGEDWYRIAIRTPKENEKLRWELEALL